MKEAKVADVGVVIGRFQVDELHDGHRDLLNSVAGSHQRLIIIVGLSQCKCTVNNPLDYEARRAMLQEQYPDATIMYITDIHDDNIWSNDLDNMLNNIVGPEQSICLYGSRDSFIPYYHGKHPTRELVQETYISGTEKRKQLSIRPKNTTDFRRGAIWAMSNQYPGPRTTVDVAIFNDDYSRILLGRKKKETAYRIIGGFVQSGESLEEAVVREGKEETHLDLTGLSYVTSMPIDDWRYRGERDKITTTLFTAHIAGGKPEPDDDIHELKWFDFNNDLIGQLVPNHNVLIDILLKKAQE
jgi:bifunctional NMN adenylyltransferase/nudix hydrolase